jgi:predicted alpha/beta superfamily hydrolase
LVGEFLFYDSPPQITTNGDATMHLHTYTEIADLAMQSLYARSQFMKPELAFEIPRCYKIRVRGHLNHHWKEWLDGLEISYEKHGITVLTGKVVDQPQLHGILLKIRDLGLSLVSVSEVINEQDSKSIKLTEFNVNEKEITIGREIKVHSKILKEDRPILISLPSDYHECIDKYPVLYHLDGFENFFHLADSTIRYLSEWEKIIPPMILVTIPNTDRNREMFPTPASLPTGEAIGGESDNLLKFIETELVSYIDDHYRTRPNRILFGTSNGGLTTIYALLNQSHIFDAFIVSNPTLSWDKNFIFRKAEAAFKVWQPTQQFLYMICGKENLENIRQEILDFEALLADQSPANLTWGCDVSDEALHCPYRSLYDGLTRIFGEWDYGKAQ